MSHLRAADGTVLCEHEKTHEPATPALALVESDDHDHEHSHGLVDRSILRSRPCIRAVSWSLAILTLTAVAQAFIYRRTFSVALLAGLGVVLAIFISALVAFGQTIERFVHARWQTISTTDPGEMLHEAEH